MEPVRRMIVNTAAQYVKALINIALSLYSTRLILEALSISDYGLYSVVGGLVAMLGFITNALVITTQRYISYYHGSGDSEYVRKLFTNSLLLHLFIGIGLAVLLYLPEYWLMNHVLNIDESRIQVAIYVYEITILMLFITVLTAPFKALFIARENIVYISIVEVCDGIVKLLLAIFLLSVKADKLLVYAGMMALILFANLLAFAIYALLRFDECSIIIRKKDIEKECMVRLIGFAGWTTYGMGAVAARNQGTAVILNHFFGTTINAAYGIAFQIYSAVSFVATSILNAMNPQIMKAEGGGDRKRTLMLAERESKYSTALMAVVSIPLIVEMPSVLALWLKEVPEGTTFFCRCILGAFLCDQMSFGLHTANQALGNIRNYTLLVYTPKLLTLVVIWLLLEKGYGINAVMFVYVLVEFVVALVRLPYLKITAGLKICMYVKNVILPLLPLCLGVFLVGWLCSSWNNSYSSLLNIFMMLIVGCIMVWCFTLDKNERAYFKTMINKRRGLPC